MQHAATHRGAVPLPAFRCTTGFVVDTLRWLGLPLARKYTVARQVPYLRSPWVSNEARCVLFPGQVLMRGKGVPAAGE